MSGMSRRAFLVAATFHVAQVAVAATAVVLGATSPLWLAAVVLLSIVAIAATLSPLWENLT